MDGINGFEVIKQVPANAHISEDGTRVQTLREHLLNTAETAARFAAPFDAEAQAHLAGVLHDIGKYSDAFQRRLNGSPERVDHSTAGAKEAFSIHQPEVAFAVAGHHGGLPDGGSKTDLPEDATLLGRLKRVVEKYDCWREEVTLPDTVQKKELPNDSFTAAFFTRMLYSCLVDADYLDTEAFFEGKPAEQSEYEPIEALLNKLRDYIQPWWDAKNELNARRCEILRACLEKGEKSKRGLFTLTVPTGGGKTISSLAFALSLAHSNHMDRVIYVIPYTSIIDQTASTFSEALGPENVLEHHSGAEYICSENDPVACRKAYAVENWDAPVVITTAVQFFESLFANRSSRCRKLHNIANSIIIFDEAQTFPKPYLRPCVAAIAQLVLNYRCAAVLCTATQPALEPLFDEFAPGMPVEEICSDRDRQYSFFRRTNLRDLGTLKVDELVRRLNAATQVLCVVNSRKMAQDLSSLMEGKNNYCLTTLLYPAHRKNLLEEIRKRLKEGLPCRVVSTSLIEAGVDVDFPEAYREMAGLDSILQTAGRCNREGRRSAEESIVSVFRIEGQPVIQMLEKNVASTNEVLRDFADPTNLDAIKRYFTFERILIGADALDKKRILEGFTKGMECRIFPFASAAEKFRLIETPAKTVYIPKGEGEKLIEDLRKGFRSQKLFRKLGQFGVTVYPDHLKDLERAGLVEWLDEEVAILTDMRCYDPVKGLSILADEGAGYII